MTSRSTDFDFMIGDWTVRHRRLDSRLMGCTDWTCFDGRSSTRHILSGLGNVEDNVLQFPDGDVKAVALRSFDPGAGTWSIWWLDGRRPHHLDVPVIGTFAGTTGTFYAEDALQGRPIRVRFVWQRNPGGNPTWEQAFSDDDGASWETNWTMEFERVA